MIARLRGMLRTFQRLDIVEAKVLWLEEAMRDVIGGKV